MGNRPERVADAIRDELSRLLSREVHDPGVGFVTLTKVKVSPDAGRTWNDAGSIGAGPKELTFSAKGELYASVAGGAIKRSGDTQARLLRDGAVVYEGKIGSLRRFKDDVSEVKTGFECGIGFEKYNDIKVGDVIEVFVNERVATPV